LLKVLNTILENGKMSAGMQYNETDMTGSITDLSFKELEDLVTSMGEPVFRAQQLARWVYRRLAISYDEMTDLPLLLRQKLSERYQLHAMTPVTEVKSKDGTVKVLFRLGDGATIETALMLYAAGEGRARNTICVSTQAGCAIGCPFCATGQQGFIRNLTSGEIIDQVLYFARKVNDAKPDGGARVGHITNIVFMGMGEPLANYEALLRAIETINDPAGFGIGARSITVSTVGLVPQIEKLVNEPFQVGLAVSLHAAENDTRDRLVPVNKLYPLDEVLEACRQYVEKTGRRVTFEYTLFSGINDSTQSARLLAGLLKGMNCHVNLIAANTTTNPEYRPSSKRVILEFEGELKRLGVNCTVRASRGQDIDAGCGQLRGRFLPKDN